MSAVALRCEGVRVALGGREVLHAVDLALPAGRWTAIAGPNGAGKTTLLKAFAQLLPVQGHVLLQGRPAADWSARERARALAWLGQAEGGAEDLLARDVVMLGRLPHQADWLAIVRRQVARGGTVVSVLHEIALALQADDLLLLRDGRVAHHGPTGDPATHRALEQVFDGRVQVHAVAGRWVALPAEVAS